MVKIKKEDLKDSKEGGVEKRLKTRYSFFTRLRMMGKQRAEHRHRRMTDLKRTMEKAGLSAKPSHVSRFMLVLCVIINLFITVYAIVRFYDLVRANVFFILLLLVVIWALIFFLVLFVLWFLFYAGLDVAIFKRKQKLEAVLPAFLQLASSNIRAGMTIDQALWFSVRPRFGILAKEIEDVAKRTFAGESLDVALQHFVKKYDSKLLERSMNLLIEGVRAGGEIGGLLNKIASNIQEINIMKKEMAANVTTYVIFITFATVMAAPFLFGMAYQLVIVIQEVFSRVNISPGTVSGFPIQISKGVISSDDFLTFAIVCLLITSFFSAIIISAIKKGNIKGGVKYIPIFMISSIVIFLVIVKMFSFIVGGFF